MNSIAKWLVIILIFLSSCDTSNHTAEGVEIGISRLPAITPTPKLKRTPNVKAPDFRNFSFPICFKSIPEIAPELKKITLKNGKMLLDQGDFGLTEQILGFELVNVSTKDLTGDGKEEALVTLGVRYFQGFTSAILLYDLSGRRPRLIWTREFGDAAFGGLRKIEFTDDGLITEEYGTARARNHPTSFIRKRYRLKDGKISETESATTEVDLDQAKFLGFPDTNEK